MIKKLTSKKEEKKKSRQNQIIISIALVGLMLVSTFGILSSSFGEKQETEEIMYNGYKFQKINNFYILSIGDTQFYFITNPQKLGQIEINTTKLLNSYAELPLYIDSTNQMASSEIYKNLAQYVQKIQYACINKDNCQDETYPIKTCKDNIIIIRESKENQIYQEENCIFIKGSQENLTRLTDKFLFKIIGIDM